MVGVDYEVVDVDTDGFGHVDTDDLCGDGDVGGGGADCGPDVEE